MSACFIIEEDQSVTVQIAPGHAFSSGPKLEPADDQSPTVTAATNAITSVGDYLDQFDAIRKDATLSELGKTSKAAPVLGRMAEALAAAWSAAEAGAADADDREARLTAFPKLDPSHQAVAIEDVEIRNWWRSLGVTERAQMAARIDAEPGHERLMLALLRSPIPNTLDNEASAIRGVWERTKRLDNPGETVAIDSARRNAEWSRRALLTATAMSLRITKSDKTLLLQKMLASANPAVQKGYSVLGLNQMDAELERRNVEARKMIAEVNAERDRHYQDARAVRTV